MAFNLTRSTSWSERDGESLVRRYIDDTLTTLLDELSLAPSEGRPSITLRRRTNATSAVINPSTGALEANQQERVDRTYTWPGSTALEAWKFSMDARSHSSGRHANHDMHIYVAVIIRVLAIVDQALRTGQRISKRQVAP